MRIHLLFVLALLGACASEPPRYNEVITLKAGQTPPPYQSPGTVLRLDEADLKALSPAPIVPAPPPPRIPPPRPNASYPPPPPGYGVPPPWY